MDLTRLLRGPLASKGQGPLGAEVVKRAGHGAPIRDSRLLRAPVLRLDEALAHALVEHYLSKPRQPRG
jgi:crotonobetainyl-CoA:carnitine CoA-transferase CaiB-like acyl-CoA transferase